MVVLEFIGMLTLLILGFAFIYTVLIPILTGKRILWQFRQCPTKDIDELHEKLAGEKEKTEASKIATEIKNEMENRRKNYGN